MANSSRQGCGVRWLRREDLGAIFASLALTWLFLSKAPCSVLISAVLQSPAPRHQLLHRSQRSPALQRLPAFQANSSGEQPEAGSSSGNATRASASTSLPIPSRTLAQTARCARSRVLSFPCPPQARPASPSPIANAPRRRRRRRASRACAGGTRTTRRRAPVASSPPTSSTMPRPAPRALWPTCTWTAGRARARACATCWPS